MRRTEGLEDRRGSLGLTGEIQGEEIFFALDAGPNVAGSDPSSHIVLDCEGVSRRHALLLVESRGVQVIDQRSKNGTFVNGQRVLSAAAEPGDELWIGPAELKLVAVSAGDTELALEIEQPAEPRSRRDDRSTEQIGRPADPRLGLWLSLLRAFVERIGAPATDVSTALAVLIERLPAAGACLIERVSSREPVILAACGALDDALERQVNDVEPFPEDGPVHGGFVASPEGTVLWQAVGRGWLGIAVAGDFPGRLDSEPLLRVLLAIYGGSVHEPDHELPTKEPHGRLRFPAGHVCGISTAATAMYAEMEPLAASDLPVLIVGETGVGKEMLARTFHLSSSRRAATFVAINCAAIPVELLEAELFGVGKGVATGVIARQGKFALAQGGTLFLDEISEMPVELQAKLLRALQEKEIQPVGEKPLAIDVRVVSATNADISERLESGTFRRDLYYRLAGFVLRVPPMRQRAADVPALVEHLLRRFSAEAEKPLRGLTVAAMRALQTYPWPGNVRELEHEIRRLVHLCPTGQVVRSSMLSAEVLRGRPAPEPDDAPSAVPESPPDPLPTLNLAALEERAIREALRLGRGNQVEAARLLGVSRFALRRRLERHGL